MSRKLKKISSIEYVPEGEEKTTALRWRKRFHGMNIELSDVSMRYLFHMPKATAHDLWSMGEPSKLLQGKDDLNVDAYIKESIERLKLASVEQEIGRIICGKAEIENSRFQLIEEDGSCTTCHSNLEISIKEGSVENSSFFYMEANPNYGDLLSKDKIIFEMYLPTLLFNGLWENATQYPTAGMTAWVYLETFEDPVDAALGEPGMSTTHAIERSGVHRCFIHSVSLYLPKEDPTTEAENSGDEEIIAPQKQHQFMALPLAKTNQYINRVAWGLWALVIVLLISLR